MSGGASADIKWLRRDNDRRRQERYALRDTRCGRMLERDREWAAAMAGNRCAVDRIVLRDDGTVVKWRGF